MSDPGYLRFPPIHGDTIVFDRSAVLWSDPALDITAKLNAKMQ